jgi:hypothetical protein
MSDPRLLSHLKRHPLTHDQALRLRVLTAFPDRTFSRLSPDTRLVKLGLARALAREIVQVSDLGLRFALGPDNRFRLPERHPFFRSCRACHGAGLANEAEHFSSARVQARRCPDCRGTGYRPAFSTHANHA